MILAGITSVYQQGGAKRKHQWDEHATNKFRIDPTGPTSVSMKPLPDYKPTGYNIKRGVERPINFDDLFRNKNVNQKLAQVFPQYVSNPGMGSMNITTLPTTGSMPSIPPVDTRPIKQDSENLELYEEPMGIKNMGRSADTKMKDAGIMTSPVGRGVANIQTSPIVRSVANIQTSPIGRSVANIQTSPIGRSVANIQTDELSPVDVIMMQDAGIMTSPIGRSVANIQTDELSPVGFTGIRVGRTVQTDMSSFRRGDANIQTDELSPIEVKMMQDAGIMTSPVGRGVAIIQTDMSSFRRGDANIQTDELSPVEVKMLQDAGIMTSPISPGVYLIKTNLSPVEVKMLADVGIMTSPTGRNNGSSQTIKIESPIQDRVIANASIKNESPPNPNFNRSSEDEVNTPKKRKAPTIKINTNLVKTPQVKKKSPKDVKMESPQNVKMEIPPNPNFGEGDTADQVEGPSRRSTRLAIKGTNINFDGIQNKKDKGKGKGKKK